MKIMSKKYLKITGVLLSVMMISMIAGCTKEQVEDDGRIKVVATTTMLADLTRVIGGDLVQVNGLMGPGIDPHLYKASAGDVNVIQEAELVVYNGLDLESKLGEIFARLENEEKVVVMITEGISDADLIMDEETRGYDPHVWFDVNLWKMASTNLLEGLVKADPMNKDVYTNNHEAYVKELEKLDGYVKGKVELIPESSRIIITAHDAFQYFGKAYGMEVLGLQGISTESEAGTGDVKSLADYIVEKQIKAIFVESSVPMRNIEALQEAVKAQGFEVEIGGELYSDSLGSAGTDAETYIGTIRSNVETIVNALK
ncbi:metal ABC transporter solute-binding protein, Zn/Mn family [Petrocella sp. FN5]|uniref:metal ABC transporter solute-binding protein, Zn/Mn family n=1 Tax=Petrocella sp. FN5 TaxID=3032002 RepID=UPI0023DA0B2A|nr:zinc ABC transporter substrate-binding protein [Petrocella sp. FN5]MDF1618312.1 zinc ABC transporter substrate-binding protein [Petrocella sp. FN5]